MAKPGFQTGAKSLTCVWFLVGLTTIVYFILEGDIVNASGDVYSNFPRSFMDRNTLKRNSVKSNDPEQLQLPQGGSIYGKRNFGEQNPLRFYEFYNNYPEKRNPGAGDDVASSDNGKQQGPYQGSGSLFGKRNFLLVK